MEQCSLIASVISSAAKASLSQQKKQKKAIRKPKHPSSPKSNRNDVTASANQGTVANTEAWIYVGPKKSSKAAPVVEQEESAVGGKETTALTNNAFYVPKKLEKHIHQQKVIVQHKKSSLDEDTLPQKVSKSYRKNQARRSRKRAKNRLMKEEAALLRNKVSLLQDNSVALQQQVKGVSIAEAEDASKEPMEEIELATSSTDQATLASTSVPTEDCPLLSLPYEVLTNNVLSFLRPEEMSMLGASNKYAKRLCEDGFLWATLFRQRFPTSQLSPTAMQEWKRAYQLSLSKIVDRLRCFSTHKTFMEDVMGVLVNFTVNPKTKVVDHIELSQDLVSETAFVDNRVRQDVFGNSFKLFLPLYFSEEHFQRALPRIKKTILALARSNQDDTHAHFQPNFILEVFSTIVTTFVVLLSDHGIAASRKSYDGITRIHRLFIALAHQYPQIQQEALRRLNVFVGDEKNRTKSACPNLGAILPLLMIVDEQVCSWRHVRLPYVQETFDRMVLWACKKYPQLERTHDSITGKEESDALGEQRVELTLAASMVPLRLVMFHVFFVMTFCKGTTLERANYYDRFFGQPEPEDMKTLAAFEEDTKPTASTAPSAHSTNTFYHFRDQINYIMSVQSWQRFYAFIGLPCPLNKAEMARRLRYHVSNSRRKKYHRAGMDFSRVQASGTSRILSKGQEYSASSDLQHVVFRDTWTFQGYNVKYLDATCLLYKGKKLLELIDYRHTTGSHGAVTHSGDVMTENSGSHTINLNLRLLDPGVTSCVFVLSAYNGATLSEILTPSVSFDNADADEGQKQLCTYDLDSQDKVSYLTSVIMCRLYRVSGGDKAGKWHVQAIGDSHRGDASNYAPIYEAVSKLL